MDIIFDFGNVLVKFDPLYMTEKYIADTADAKKVSGIIFDREIWDRLDAGELLDEEAVGLELPRVPEELRDGAKKAHLLWYTNLPDVPGMRDLVKKLAARGDRLFVLSNISRSFAEKYREEESLTSLFENFEGLAFSGVTGRLKPGRDSFLYLAEKYGLDLEKCWFVDDNAGNIAGAEALGIRTFLFRGDAEALARALGL